MVIKLYASRISCIRQGRAVFRNLNFNLYSGDLLLVLGKNGSGKSTLLKILSGLLAPSEGFVRSFKGSTNQVTNIREISHYITDDIVIRNEMTSLENVTYWSYIQDPNKDLSYHIMKAISSIKLFNLSEYTYTRCKYLSFGQRKRLSLLRLLLNRRDIWLLDEPTIGLDSESINIFSSILDEHRKSGGIVVISSHSPIFISRAKTLDLGAAGMVECNSV